MRAAAIPESSAIGDLDDHFVVSREDPGEPQSLFPVTQAMVFSTEENTRTSHSDILIRVLFKSICASLAWRLDEVEVTHEVRCSTERGIRNAFATLVDQNRASDTCTRALDLLTLERRVKRHAIVPELSERAKHIQLVRFVISATAAPDAALAKLLTSMAPNFKPILPKYLVL